MKKIVGFTLIIACVSLALSCSHSETYADKLKKERKAINNFIDRRGIQVIKQYPENGVFGEREFFLDPNSGIYLHVVDSGNGRRATTGRKVYVRFKETGSLISNPTDADLTDTNSDGVAYQDYLYFTYGDASTYIDYSLTGNITVSNYLYKSPGMVAPLKFVGDSAIVQLIVPFKNGSGLQQTSYEPVYFGYLFYDFQKEQGE
ncbi:DUF4827 family protein [Viscerimonas tarda]